MPTILLIYVVEFTVKCPVIVCTHAVVTNVIRKPVMSGRLKADIGKVWNISK